MKNMEKNYISRKLSYTSRCTSSLYSRTVSPGVIFKEYDQTRLSGMNYLGKFVNQ